MNAPTKANEKTTTTTKVKKKTPPWTEKGMKVDKEQRRAIGRLLKGLREKQGMTQNDMAKAVGQEYFTFVSQVETGAAKFPSKDIALWARVLGVKKEVLAKEALRHYDPDMFDALFTADEQRERGI
jgi:transcriptional regulator with XRE-family HTH domain